jgi:hypothetical protein
MIHRTGPRASHTCHLTAGVCAAKEGECSNRSNDTYKMRGSKCHISLSVCPCEHCNSIIEVFNRVLMSYAPAQQEKLSELRLLCRARGIFFPLVSPTQGGKWVYFFHTRQRLI